jgi:hypothetical protein
MHEWSLAIERIYRPLEYDFMNALLYFINI